MFLSFVLGFIVGVASLLGLGVILFLYLLDWIERQNKKTIDALEKRRNRDLFVEPTMDAPSQKQGFVWILEPEKNPKVNSDGTTVSVSKEKKKSNVVEVSAVKKHARIKGRNLILTGDEGSTAKIDLSNCTVVSISSSKNSSRKWAKRYPIKIQSKEASSKLHNGNDTIYLYAETSWEKESWCKALRLACTTDPKELRHHYEMIQKYQKYLDAINSEYPSFMKHVSGSLKQLDGTNRADSQSRVRTFFKKFSKRSAAKAAVERTSSDSSRASFQDLTSSPGEGMVFEDEGKLVLNLLLSRLYFDVQNNTQIDSFIQSRIQSTFSELRTRSYIGEITCTGFSLGWLPPHIHKIRAVPIDLSEMLAFEVDFDLAGGFVVNVETRLDIQATELQNDLFDKGLKSSSCSDSGSEEEASDLLEGLEEYRRQCRSAHDLTPPQFEAKEETDGLRHSKSTNAWTSIHTSGWKNILNSIATRVNQVPLSLAIRVNSVRGTLRCHIKPPPSDRLWYGFTSMPDIDWNIETSIADHKIASRNIASLLKNRFKASIFGSMVLPNCENIIIPGLQDDWAPRKTAPFMWVNQETTPDTTKLREEPKPVTVTDFTTTVKSDITPSLDEKVECDKSMTPWQEHGDGTVVEPSSSGSYGLVNRDLSLPLLNLEKQGSSTSGAGSKSMVGFPNNQLNLRNDSSVTNGEDMKKVNRRARMMDFGKRVGGKLGENRRKFEEKGRSFVEKFRENMNTVQ